MFVALAAVGLGIAMGILPNYYEAGITASEYGGMSSPTVSFVFVEPLLHPPFAIEMLIS